MSDNKQEQKIMVGCEEWCAFPGLGIPAIAARVDSGARTSSIHAFNIQPFTRKGQPWVSFEVHPLQNNRRLVVRCEAPVADCRKVKSSSGVAEKRYVIQTVLRLWEHEFVVELTLANRDSMGYRMLLGREAMVGRIMVDPELSFNLGDVTEDVLEHHYKDARRSVDGLRIALLAEHEKYYTNRRLLEACEERGHFPTIVNLTSCYVTLDKSRSEIYERDKGVIPSYDAMIPRFSIENTLFGTGVLRQYLLKGGVAFNNPASVLNSRDKLSLLQKLMSNDIPICNFGFAYSTQDLEAMVVFIGAEPYQMQLNKHFRVKPSMRVKSSDQTQILMQALHSSSDSVQVLSHDEGALDGNVVKALVVGGRVVCALQQDKPKDPALVHDVSGHEIYHLSKEDKKLILKVAKLTGLQFLCVELVKVPQGEHELVVSDVIASPSIELFEKVTGKDIATQVVIEIEKCCDWQQQNTSATVVS